MDGLTDPAIFLGLVAFISLSGALMPGPIFATTVAKGYQDRNAGLKITAGHAVIEIPLIVAIFLGLETVLQDQTVLATIGLVGGAFLLYMGISMVRVRIEDGQVQGSRLRPLTAGVVLTAANPYFLLWWATVGASLIGLAAGYGLLMLPLFAAVHLACDLGWLQFVSMSVNRSRRFFTGRRYRVLFTACGLFLVVFALYFIASSFQSFL
ncbi:MAG: LysE family transporter [Methanomassiliicoccus sp.]|nr:LysE family transporter [Methanomassiliicoccus sp.]